MTYYERHREERLAYQKARYAKKAQALVDMLKREAAEREQERD